MIKIKGVKETLKEIQIAVEAKKNFHRKLEIAKTIKELKQVTPIDTGEARDGWIATDHSIENDVEHVKNLNEGSSKQAPAYFIEKTILNNPNLIVHGVIVRDK